MNLKQLIQDKSGTFTIYTILILSVLLPIFLFIFVDITYATVMKIRCNNYNESIASAAINNLNEEKLKDGILEIDEEQAQLCAERLFADMYGLDENLNITNTSLLKETPILKVYVVNDTESLSEGNFTTDEGYTIKVDKPTVIVYTSIQPTGILFNRFIELKSISTKHLSVEENGSSSNNESSIYIPVNFSTNNGIQVSPVPLRAGTNIEILTNIDDNVIAIDSATAKINIIGSDYKEEFIVNLENNTTKVIDEKKISLSTIPSPSNKIATWVITNSYNEEIKVDWVLNSGESGSVVVAPKTKTYFETYKRDTKEIVEEHFNRNADKNQSILFSWIKRFIANASDNNTIIGYWVRQYIQKYELEGITTIRVYLKGKLIQNGELDALISGTQKRNYKPVDNNGGKNKVIDQMYFNEFYIPEGAREGAKVYINLKFTGVDASTKKHTIKYYPDENIGTQIGYIKSSKKFISYNR